jgi:energy-coupling factor transport system ATP-binding protein
MLPRDPGTLSFGERRKVAVASVVALKPKYLILDEPLAGLDWSGRESLIDTVGRLGDDGVTTVILTHETDLASEIGDSVAIARGRTVWKPMSVSEFLNPPAGSGREMLPDSATVVHNLRDAGLDIPDRPRTVADVAAAISRALNP